MAVLTNGVVPPQQKAVAIPGYLSEHGQPLDQSAFAMRVHAAFQQLPGSFLSFLEALSCVSSLLAFESLP